VRRALGGAAGVRVVVTGMGQAAAAAAAREWVPRVRAVVVCGVCGGTGGVARAGDVVVASGVWAGGLVLPGVVAVELPGTVPGLVASVEAPVDSVRERAELLRAGVVAVETEAGGWAGACSAAGVPLAVVRGVLDTPEAPLGAAAGVVRAGERGPRVGAVAGLLVRPSAWGDLLRVGRAAGPVERRAAEAAVRAARALGG
jgi:nucleoside phosphorylase